MNKNNGDSPFLKRVDEHANNAKECFEELSGSSHMTLKILDQQNELPSDSCFAIPKTDAEVMQGRHSSARETTASGIARPITILGHIRTAPANNHELIIISSNNKSIIIIVMKVLFLFCYLCRRNRSRLDPVIS